LKKKQRERKRAAYLESKGHSALPSMLLGGELGRNAMDLNKNIKIPTILMQLEKKKKK
jgi:hypothetical protein